MPKDDSWPVTHEDSAQPNLRKNERTIKRAFAQGMSGVICSTELKDSPVFQGQNVFFASDTYALACHLATAVRNNLDHQRLTAITGSAGKSTTRNMLVHALRVAGVSKVTATPRNQNLQRMTLHRISQTPRFDHTVLEVSSSAFKAFQEKGFSVSPDVSIVTSIAEAHLDYMDSLENVAEIKSDIFQAPPAGGTAVINVDTEHADLLVRRAVSEGCQLVTYGESDEATIRLESWDPVTSETVAMVGQERFEYRLGLTGKHNAMNSLAVLAALRAHGIKSWRQGVESLAHFQALEGRGQSSLVQLPSGAEITLIDEAYNANPASVRSSLESMGVRERCLGIRRIAVLGDILELGSQSDQIHRNLADSVLNADLDYVFLFGEHMGELYDELKDRTDHVRHWPDLSSLIEELPQHLRSQDIVLMKASGSTGLNGWVKELISNLPSQTK